MIYTEKTYKHLLFCGDIHDNYDAIPNFIRDQELDTCAVFQAGDFGIGFETERIEQRRLENLNKRMIHSNSDLFSIRGNHDKPSYFDGNTVLSNVTLLKDYTVVNINGWNVLGVGGATSVDRTDRGSYWHPREGNKLNDYWKDEVFVLDEDKVKELKDIDIVVTHSAPHFCMPLTKGNIKKWLAQDDKLDTDVAMERFHITQLYGILKQNNNISEWYYGHFHMNAKSYDDKTTFVALDIDKIVQSNKLYNYGEEND